MTEDLPKITKAVLRPAAIDLEQVSAYLSLSTSTIEVLVRTGKFPRPRQLSGRRVAYLVKEIDEWLESRPVSDQLPPVNCQFGSAGNPDKKKSQPKD